MDQKTEEITELNTKNETDNSLVENDLKFDENIKKKETKSVKKRKGALKKITKKRVSKENSFKKNSQRKKYDEDDELKKKSPNDLVDLIIPEKVMFYAYKDDLGVFNSFVKHPSIPLWKRDGTFLFQKFFRTGYDGLTGSPIYTSSLIYNCWDEDRASEYLSMDGIIIQKSKNDKNMVAQVQNLEEIENICNQANYKELGLPPYVSKANVFVEIPAGAINQLSVQNIFKQENSQVDLNNPTVVSELNEDPLEEYVDFEAIEESEYYVYEEC